MWSPSGRSWNDRATPSPSTKKKFVLQLELRKELDPAECHWNDASVGRVVLMMKKKERSHWENIIAVCLL